MRLRAVKEGLPETPIAETRMLIRALMLQERESRYIADALNMGTKETEDIMADIRREAAGYDDVEYE